MNKNRFQPVLASADQTQSFRLTSAQLADGRTFTDVTALVDVMAYLEVLADGTIAPINGLPSRFSLTIDEHQIIRQQLTTPWHPVAIRKRMYHPLTPNQSINVVCDGLNVSDDTHNLHIVMFFNSFAARLMQRGR